MKRCDILNFILALEVNAVNSVCGVYSWMEKGILGGKIRRIKHLAEETAEGLHDIPFDLCISSPL